ncbi:hypothetical protein EN802_31980 [bacterium M00.F.Ca.ET.159.01.1.1]|nr:hypothetical protein EN802_31980 [bacterium M00.F.Ca.ET.159.01.1.1]TGT79439.1 hypothetical protein EN800_31320 [bacterium M00.F.Ca.ET.157.01.1.1]
MFDAMKLLDLTNDRLFVDSLAVAERFGKQHKNVLRDIEGIECSEEFYRLNFEPVEYEDSRGRLQPKFRMTRDGFSLLVMGFNGRRAMQPRDCRDEEGGSFWVLVVPVGWLPALGNPHKPDASSGWQCLRTSLDLVQSTVGTYGEFLQKVKDFHELRCFSVNPLFMNRFCASALDAS